MKRFLIIMIAFVMLFVSSCKSTPPSSEEGVSTSPQTTSEPDFGIISSIKNDNAESKVKPINGIFDEYYTDISFNLKNLSNVVSEYILSEDASDEIKNFNSSSNEMKLLPVYGSYLEKTTLVFCCFFQNGELIGTKTVNVYVDGEDATIKEFLDIIPDKSAYKSSFDDARCCNAMKACLEKYPDFEILGFVFNAIGYPMPIPIGVDEEDEYIKYYSSALNEFKMIEPFSSLEEGTRLFADYWKQKTELLESIPFYDLEMAQGYTEGYLNKYRLDDAYENLTYKDIEHLYYFDSTVFVPLFDSEGKEDVYVLYLLYYHDSLIGEIVLKVDQKIYVAVKEIKANKDATGEGYIPLGKIDYIDTVTKLVDNESNINSVKGVGFDGTNYILVYDAE